ncbi:YihY/virulence factor BrkB family protein [Actinomadura scrupuli]|uniref:YihY/virulence factor BrkB family protein n=1 Tax=Actinomadura scrupuli TaxID=559629 RepID=UPI003D976774
MGTATKVPQSRTMSGEELSADDAWHTLRHTGAGQLLRDAFLRFRYSDGFTNSRALAFQIFLTTIPGVIALVGISASVHQRQLAQVLQEVMLRLTPGTGRQLVEDALSSGRRVGEGSRFAVVFGGVTAFASLVTAMGQIERAANRIYGVERDRPFHRKYGRAMLMAVTAGSTMIAGFVILVAGREFGEACARVYHWPSITTTLWSYGRWPLGLLMALVSASVLFRSAPRRRQPGYSWLAFGGGLALALWLLFSWLLVQYVERASSFGSTYGPLTGVVALLLWSLLSSMALFFGIAFSAQLEACRTLKGEPVENDPGA